MPGRGLEDIEQGRDIGVDAAAEILQIDQQYVEDLHRLIRRPADLAIEAETGNIVNRVGEVGRLHHIVLKVAAHAMLRPEYRGEIHHRSEEHTSELQSLMRISYAV